MNDAQLGDELEEVREQSSLPVVTHLLIDKRRWPGHTANSDLLCHQRHVEAYVMP